ncbi:glycosyltransferase family 9 protein [bacterium]|nr:glycosyltransferase family 9 protein [bacterium]
MSKPTLASNPKGSKEGTSSSKRCLVIQLARLGDTLQSLTALRAAKQLYPQLEIHFLARETFASAAKRVPWIEKVITFPTQDILGPVLHEGAEAESMGELAKWLAPVVKENWDFIFNWTYSEASSYLTAIIPGQVKYGLSRREDLTLSTLDGWSQYICGVVQEKTPQNIHLTDIFATQLLTALQIHLGESVEDGNVPVNSKKFFDLASGIHPSILNVKKSERRWIGIQIGAGRGEESWDAHHWAQVAHYVLSRNTDCGIVLLGDAQERALAQSFSEKLNQLGSSALHEVNLINLVGQTGFDDWAQVIGSCQWLLSCDSSAIHLASVLGTRVLNISLTSNNMSETGPYGNGHYIISGSGITPESVYATWTYASSEWAHRRQLKVESHFSQLGWTDKLENVVIHRSKIRSLESGGGVVYEILSNNPITIDEWLSQVVGYVARAWYCGWVPEIGHEVQRTGIRPDLIQNLRKVDEAAMVLTKIFEEGKRTSVELQQRGSRLVSNRLMDVHEKDEIQRLGKKVGDLESLTERMGRTQPALQPFVKMSRVLMHGLDTSEISRMGRESAHSFMQLTQGLSLMRDWVKHTLQLAKPMAIQTSAVISIENGREKDLGL